MNPKIEVIMPLPILILLLIAASMAFIAASMAFIATIIAWSIDGKGKIEFFISLVVMTGLSTWLILSVNKPLQIKEETYHKVLTSEDNKQFIVVEDRIVNLNRKLGRCITEKQIKRILYKQWYLGVLYTVEPDYEAVKEN